MVCLLVEYVFLILGSICRRAPENAKYSHCDKEVEIMEEVLVEYGLVGHGGPLTSILFKGRTHCARFRYGCRYS